MLDRNLYISCLLAEQRGPDYLPDDADHETEEDSQLTETRALRHTYASAGVTVSFIFCFHIRNSDVA